MEKSGSIMGTRLGRRFSRFAGTARQFFHSLRFRLLALVLLGVIPSVGLILYTAAEQRAYASQEVQEGALRLARLVAADHERLVDDTRQLLITLSYLPVMAPTQSGACSQVFSELLVQYPQYANLGLVSLDGTLLCNGAQPETTTAAHFPYVYRVLSERGFVSSGFHIDPLSGKPVLYFALPVLDSRRQPESVIFAALNLDWLNQLVTASQLPDEAVLMVVDRNGSVLVYSPDPEGWVGRKLKSDALFAAMINMGEGTAELPGLDGVDRLYGFTQMYGTSPSNMYVGVGLLKESAFAWVDQALYRHLAGLSMVVVLALVAAWIGGDLFVVRRVKVLVDTTRRLAAGDYRARTGLNYGQGELSQLARVFDQMSAVLEQREEEHQYAEAIIRRQLRDLSALNTITATVSSSLELLEVLESLKRLLIEQFSVPGGAIFSYNESEHKLCLEAAWGVPAAVLAGLKSLPASLYHYPRVIEQRMVYLQPDFRQVEPYASSGLDNSRPNLQSYLCIPLTAQGRVQGVVDMFSHASYSFSPEQVDLFAVMGQEVGVALQNASLFEEVNASRSRLRLLSQQLIEVQENERRHIARELHDEIGQALTAVKVNLQTIGRMSADSSLSPYMRESIAIIDRTIHQIRNLSLDLRPSLLDDLGVVSALRWYVDRQAQRGSFEAAFTAHPPDMRFSSTLETTCFRVVQEALTNVVRHAKANRVSVNIEKNSAFLEIQVVDNGVGFDLDAIQDQQPDKDSLGLLGMKERVELVGGTLEIRSTPHAGTEIRACLPIPRNLEGNHDQQGK
jgi:signal transduction histidine kinase